ncbi:nhl repeat-containing protein, putative [Entamoeba dispar SAW760]|uniref:Nhl repeat-containing protein, putative n=1 Tax=Entamoeba dispar (strain ATCC PRA-260 / SAW760) TaxID=370354 RepID=B0EH16_ENTDS|nr:nhl repeat-containing protein, putative [Entamoeba dispar SAW760]EDR26184.1 nhl repeat-containing protein, putative [Entamoeba dispar SAW760]|eukprot:EDR26184.1 nhl repeat-containing protein, putative [Entamoeba dispar SAW760]
MEEQLIVLSINKLYGARKVELKLQLEKFKKKREELDFFHAQLKEMLKQINKLGLVDEFNQNQYYQSMNLKCNKSLQHVKEMINKVNKLINEIYHELNTMAIYMYSFRNRDSFYVGIQQPTVSILNFTKGGGILSTNNVLLTNNDLPDVETFTNLISDKDFIREFIPMTHNNHFSPAFSCVTRYHNDSYITGDINNHSIKLIRLRKDGKESEDFSVKVEYPTSIVEYKNSSIIYITDKQLHCVHVFNMIEGRGKTFGGYGNEPGKFNEPMCVAIDSSDRVYVADAMNSRIQIFTLDGTYLSTLSIVNQRKPFYPHCILFDENELIVIDNWGSSIFTIDPKQKKVTSIISRYGGAKGLVNRPTFGCIDEHGRLFVSDSGNNRIVCFQKTTFIGSIEMSELGLVGAPLGISANCNKITFSTTTNEPYLNSVMAWDRYQMKL